MTDDRRRNILFHGVGTPRRELEPGEDRMWISVDEFHRILDEIATWPNARISFDDGNTSDIEIGLEALVQRGLTAKFFVLAGRFGQGGSLTESETRELHRNGMTVGSHGMNHRRWRAMDGAARHAEFVDARARISDAVGCPVDEAAAPLGSYDRKVVTDLRSLGYSSLHTSDRRTARVGAWMQPRYSVRRDDTAESIRADVLAAEAVPRRFALSAKGFVKRLR